MTQDNAATADAVARKGLHKEERPKLDYQAFAPMVTLMLWRYRQEVLTFFSISSLLLPSVSIVTNKLESDVLNFFWTAMCNLHTCGTILQLHQLCTKAHPSLALSRWLFFFAPNYFISTHCRSKILSTKAPRDCTSFSSLCYLLPLCCNNNDSTLHACLFTASGI